ncbi:unnamed protein product [Leuciscus chuanchicus]
MSRVRQLVNPAMESLGSAMKGSRCDVSNWAEGFLAARFESWNAIENEAWMNLGKTWPPTASCDGPGRLSRRHISSDLKVNTLPF